MAVLVVNAGSSSLKLSVLDQTLAVLASDELGLADGQLDEAAVIASLARLPKAEAVGHRVVHGGAEFVGPVQIDAGVQARIGALRTLAPLHQDRALAGIDAVRTAWPGVPAVACFDTALHAGLPAAAAAYALPDEWVTRHRLRRYGFHGLSHAHVARRVEEVIGHRPRIVSCHLGAGASLAAIRDGRSGSTRRRFAAPPPPAWGSWGSPSTSSSMLLSCPTLPSRHRSPPPACSSSRRAKTLRSCGRFTRS